MGDSHLLRAPLVALAMLVGLAGCSSEPGLGDYAADVEVLVTTMNDRLDELDPLVTGTPDLEDVQHYASGRVDARLDFVAGLSALEPPDEAAELHEAALAIMGRLAEAESALADRVAGLTELPDEDIWATPEGRAARAADQDAVDLCLVAQSNLNETEAREEFADVPWVPPQMKEVVVVALGCLADER